MHERCRPSFRKISTVCMFSKVIKGPRCRLNIVVIIIIINCGKTTHTYVLETRMSRTGMASSPHRLHAASHNARHTPHQPTWQMSHPFVRCSMQHPATDDGGCAARGRLPWDANLHLVLFLFILRMHILYTVCYS
jgi:hypothetical protein